MKRATRFVLVSLVTVMAFVIVIGGSITESAADQLFDVGITSSQIVFYPKTAYGSVTLNIALPDSTVKSEIFSAGASPFLNISGTAGRLSDGKYTYELRVGSTMTNYSRSSDESGQLIAPASPAQKSSTQTGHFLITNGSFYVPANTPEQHSKGAPTQAKTSKNSLGPSNDIPNLDDVIITGSLCVGFDCLTDGTENFGFDTIRLKENNLRIHFDDTSSTAGFPANDWRIVVNDTASGGANYFAIEDSTAAATPFMIEAGAPTSSFYIDDYGKVGIGTATPVLAVHVQNGNTPGVRLDQDTSGGYTAQVWDVAGNEANFFIRDVTGGSKLPFRMQPGAPTSSLTVKSDGKVGMGTWSPGWAVEIQRTGTVADLAVVRTDGAGNIFNAGANYANFGSIGTHPMRLLVNSTWKMQLNNDNSVAMVNGASLTAGGVWTNASSRDYKENITELSAADANETLKGLNPVLYNYKVNKAEKHVGFIAEDVPEMVATKDRKSLSALDIVAVLTRVVQQQDRTIETLSDKLAELEAEINKLKGRDYTAQK
jgi:hypothetical protein